MYLLVTSVFGVKGQRYLARDYTITYEPRVVKFSPSSDWVWVIAEAGRIVEDYQVWVATLNFWPASISTDKEEAIDANLRGNHIVLESLCQTSPVDL
jgi:hypothetical protein